MSQHFDAIVIGTGQSGPSLAARLAGTGLRVAIIERGKFGGTCVNNGCIPTKTLVASAYAAHLARRAGEYGVETGPVRVDMQRVKARKDEISGDSSRASNIGCATHQESASIRDTLDSSARTACRSEMMCWRVTAFSSTLVADHSSRQCPDWSRRHS